MDSIGDLAKALMEQMPKTDKALANLKGTVKDGLNSLKETTPNHPPDRKRDNPNEPSVN